MTLLLHSDWIAAERARRYRRRMDLRIQTLEAAIEYVNDVGFAMFFPIKGVEAPSLFDAVAGRVRAMSSAHDDPDISLCWGWKDASLGKDYWYYAHLLRRKATLIAPRLWGAFYALTRNYGDLHDYQEQVRDGIMTHEARQIYEALLAQGPLNTIELRRQAQLSARESKSRFDRGLLDLQIDMKALPVGVAEAGAWRYSFIYDIPMRHYPDLVSRAQGGRHGRSLASPDRPARGQRGRRDAAPDRADVPCLRPDPARNRADAGGTGRSRADRGGGDREWRRRGVGLQARFEWRVLSFELKRCRQNKGALFGERPFDSGVYWWRGS